MDRSDNLSNTEGREDNEDNEEINEEKESLIKSRNDIQSKVWFSLYCSCIDKRTLQFIVLIVNHYLIY